MLRYTLDTPLTNSTDTAVEVTLDVAGGRRWLFFITPQALADNGDLLGNTGTRWHLGERHMIVLGEISTETIAVALEELRQRGELESRSLPLN